MIPNGVDLPDIEPEKAAARNAYDAGQRTALFLGRIYPVKGLPMLVEGWARVRPQGWRLQIAGPDEAGHRAEVERAISVSRLNGVVSFLGPVEDEAKTSACFNADLFILPSYSESFGVAVGEALAHGLPVLTTKGAPWPELAVRGCGWSVDPTVEGIAEGLRQATSQDARSVARHGREGPGLGGGGFWMGRRSEPVPCRLRAAQSVHKVGWVISQAKQRHVYSRHQCISRRFFRLPDPRWPHRGGRRGGALSARQALGWLSRHGLSVIV